MRDVGSLATRRSDELDWSALQWCVIFDLSSFGSVWWHPAIGSKTLTPTKSRLAQAQESKRKTRRVSHAIPGFLMLAKVETKDTQSVITAPIKQAKKRFKVLSWAQSSEMAGHRGFTMAAKIEAYFCHPNRPRQRSGIENTNRRLRP
ncbi:MAG: hypothetical protein AB8B51_19925 [Sedimentitalea sp.]